MALDGTNIHAYASRHSALSYEHASKIEAQLQAEVAGLMPRAEAADQADAPDGMSIPEELARREERLAKERHAREQAEYEARMARARPGPRPPTRSPAADRPDPTHQVNLTSRIMSVPGGGFEQCYNAQATGSLLVVVVLDEGLDLSFEAP